MNKLADISMFESLSGNPAVYVNTWNDKPWYEGLPGFAKGAYKNINDPFIRQYLGEDDTEDPNVHVDTDVRADIYGAPLNRPVPTNISILDENLDKATLPVPQKPKDTQQGNQQGNQQPPKVFISDADTKTFVEHNYEVAENIIKQCQEYRAKLEGLIRNNSVPSTFVREHANFYSGLKNAMRAMINLSDIEPELLLTPVSKPARQRQLDKQEQAKQLAKQQAKQRRRGSWPQQTYDKGDKDK